MKKLLPFAGFCAAVLGIVALILVLATKSVGLSSNVADTQWASGIQGLFGQPKTDSQGEIKATVGAVIAFILVIVGLVLALLASLLPMLKKAENIAGFLGLGASVALVIAGILLFCEVPMYCSAQGVDVSGSTLGLTYKYVLGGGWVVAGILAVVGGGVAFLPSLFAFLAKKK